MGNPIDPATGQPMQGLQGVGGAQVAPPQAQIAAQPQQAQQAQQAPMQEQAPPSKFEVQPNELESV